MEDEKDFPEYGQQVDLLYPLHGYSRATIIGQEGYRFLVETSSGATDYYYPDELEFD